MDYPPLAARRAAFDAAILTTGPEYFLYLEALDAAEHIFARARHNAAHRDRRALVASARRRVARRAQRYNASFKAVYVHTLFVAPEA